MPSFNLQFGSKDESPGVCGQYAFGYQSNPLSCDFAVADFDSETFNLSCNEAREDGQTLGLNGIRGKLRLSEKHHWPVSEDDGQVYLWPRTRRYSITHIAIHRAIVRL